MTPTSIRPPALAADQIRELTRPFTTSETVNQPVQGDDGRWRTTTRIHHVTHEPLLDQINDTITGTTISGEVFRSAYGSKPAGRIDCLAFLERINRQSADLATTHALPTLPLKTRLERLSGIIGDRPHHTVKAWWTTARVLTQHDGPPFSPDIPCPEENCERWGTIRARMNPNIAVCVECQETWSDDDGRFGRLAIWAEWAAEHLRGPRHWRTDEDTTGYPNDLNYRVECPECRPERVAMAEREAARLRLARTQRQADRAAS